MYGNLTGINFKTKFNLFRIFPSGKSLIRKNRQLQGVLSGLGKLSKVNFHHKVMEIAYNDHTAWTWSNNEVSATNNELKLAWMYHTGVNFINVKCTNFSYERSFSSYMLVEKSCTKPFCTKNKCLKCWWNWLLVSYLPTF